jgi:ketosteroid isomerase-like protein
VASGVFAKVPEHFSEFAVVPVTLHDAGDVVVVEGRVTGTTHTGRKLDAPAAWVWTVRNGKVVRNMNYHDNEPWREALVGTD